MNSKILKLIIPLEILLFITSIVGIFTNIYFRETINWQAEAHGQDIFNLLILFPVILVSSIKSKHGNRTAVFVLLGSLIYAVYTFAIYCFAVHFNEMFIVYCSVFGLSIYSLIYFAITFDVRLMNDWFRINNIQKEGRQNKILIYFLFAVSFFFFLLWMEQILPATFNGETPKSLIESGILTNPVHVLDLSFVLPAIFVSALLLKRNRPLGYLLAPSFLIFTLMIFVMLAVLMIILVLKGLEGNIILSIFFLVIAILCLLIFNGFINQIKTVIE